MKLIVDSTIHLDEALHQSLITFAHAWGRELELFGDSPHDVEALEDADTALVIILINGQRKQLRQYLQHARGLRMPYMFITPQMVWSGSLSKVLLPVGFLEEEVGKAQYAAAFGRFCGSSICVLKPHDYGTRAQKNIDKSMALFDKFSLNYTIIEGKKDSFKIEEEAARRVCELDSQILIISSSRDYGLDDILFGPKEQHVIEKATIPVILVNPRKDLYSLCD